MKKRKFLITIIVTNIAFVILLIHKKSTITGLMYKKQRCEQELYQLVKKEDKLKHELCDLQDRNTIKAYAHTYLNMSPISIKQIKKLAHG